MFHQLALHPCPFCHATTGPWSLWVMITDILYTAILYMILRWTQTSVACDMERDGLRWDANEDEDSYCIMLCLCYKSGWLGRQIPPKMRWAWVPRAPARDSLWRNGRAGRYPPEWGEPWGLGRCPWVNEMTWLKARRWKPLLESRVRCSTWLIRNWVLGIWSENATGIYALTATRDNGYGALGAVSSLPKATQMLEFRDAARSG